MLPNRFAINVHIHSCTRFALCHPSEKIYIYTYVYMHCTIQLHACTNTQSHRHTHTCIRGEQAAHKCAHPSYSVSRNNYVLLDSKRQAHIPLTRNRAHTPVFCTYIFYSRIFVDFNSFLVLWRFNYHVDAFTTAFGHFDCFPF